MRIQHQTNTTENLIYSFRWKFIVFKYFRQKGRRIVEYFQLTIEVSKMVTGSQKTYIVTLNLKFRQYVDKKELMRQPALGRSVLVENDQWRKQWHGLFHENGAQSTNKTLVILTIFDRS